MSDWKSLENPAYVGKVLVVVFPNNKDYGVSAYLPIRSLHRKKNELAYSIRAKEASHPLLFDLGDVRCDWEARTVSFTLVLKDRATPDYLGHVISIGATSALNDMALNRYIAAKTVHVMEPGVPVRLQIAGLPAGLKIGAIFSSRRGEKYTFCKVMDCVFDKTQLAVRLMVEEYAPERVGLEVSVVHTSDCFFDRVDFRFKGTLQWPIPANTKKHVPKALMPPALPMQFYHDGQELNVVLIGGRSISRLD